MPTYDYDCDKCGRFEAFHSISNTLTECPTCQAQVKKVISGGSGIVFKGTGFYETDYKPFKPPAID